MAAELRAAENARMREQTDELPQLPSNVDELLESQGEITETAGLRHQDVAEYVAHAEYEGGRSEGDFFEQLSNGNILEPEVQIEEFETDDEGELHCKITVKLLLSYC